ILDRAPPTLPDTNTIRSPFQSCAAKNQRQMKHSFSRGIRRVQSGSPVIHGGEVDGQSCKSHTLRKQMKNFRSILAVGMMFVFAVAFTGSAFAADTHTSGQFVGPKANTGNVVHSKKDGKNILTFSDDFVVPDTPDPHVQVVDSKGNTYLLDKLKV